MVQFDRFADGTVTWLAMASFRAAIDCNPLGPVVPRNSPNAPSRLETEPSPML